MSNGASAPSPGRLQGAKDRKSRLSRFLAHVLHNHETPRQQTVTQITKKVNVDKKYKTISSMIKSRLGRQDSDGGSENIPPRDHNIEPVSTWHAGVGSPSSGKEPAYTLGLAAHEFGEPCEDCGAVAARRMYAFV